MPLLLVRHASAMRRREWSKPDRVRPLTPRGYAQADALADLLAPYGAARVLTSPYVRCVETVEPLAARLGVPVEAVDDLAEGAGAAFAHRLPDDITLVVCSHGDVLPVLFDAVAPGATIDQADFPCAKGSTWVIADDRRSARYLPPPDVS